MRKLDSENTVLRRTVEQWQSSSLREAKGITKLHGTELARARKLMYKLARETATLQFENVKLKSDFEDSKKRVQVGDKQLADTSSGLEKAESEIAALQARLCDALSERRHWEDEFLKLSKDQKRVSNCLKDYMKQLGSETVMRVSCQNRMKTRRRAPV